MDHGSREFAQGCGYETSGAKDGEEYIEILENSVPDLILLDINLPGKDGFEIFREIEKKHGDKIPVIFLTVKGESRFREMGFNLGASDYIVKPFPFVEVEKKIQNALAVSRIKRQSERTATQSPNPVSMMTQGRKPIVLVVDDHYIMRKGLSRILSEWGFTCLTATGAAKALDYAYEETLDLIVLDIMLPVMDGITLCRKMRDLEKLKDVPIIVCSGKNTKTDIDAAYKAGANDYVVKPFKKELFRKKIKKVLNLD